MVKCLGSDKDCGGSFIFAPYRSYVFCSKNCSCPLEEGGIEDGKEEEITAVVNNKNVNNRGGKMNIIRNQKGVPHTIVNIPKDGVHFGFSCYSTLSYSTTSTLSIISLLHVSVPPFPFNYGMRCIAYVFEGGFENSGLNLKDEEGKEVLNIRDYYYNINKKREEVFNIRDFHFNINNKREEEKNNKDDNNNNDKTEKEKNNEDDGDIY